jgi:hypothetical protein
VELEVCVTAFLNAVYLSNLMVVGLRFWKAVVHALTNFIACGAYDSCCEKLKDCIGDVMVKACHLKLIMNSDATGRIFLSPLGNSDHLQPLVEPLCVFMRNKINHVKIHTGSVDDKMLGGGCLRTLFYNKLVSIACLEVDGLHQAVVRLEGLCCLLEVTARLYVTGHPVFDEGLLLMWINHAFSLWESALYQVGKCNSGDGNYLCKVSF